MPEEFEEASESIVDPEEIEKALSDLESTMEEE